MKKYITLFTFLLLLLNGLRSFSQVSYPCGKYFIEMNGTSNYGLWDQAYNAPDVTLAAWVQVTDAASFGKRMAVFHRNDFNTYSENTDISVAINEGGQFVFTSRFIDAVTHAQVVDSLLFNLKPTVGKWYHIAVTFNGTSHEGKTYVNAVQTNSKTFAGPLSYVNVGSAFSHTISFGVRYVPVSGGFLNNYFKGYLDEAVYASKELSASQIDVLAKGINAGDVFLKDNSIVIYHKFDDYPTQPNYGIGPGTLPTGGQYHYCPATNTTVKISGIIAYIADGSLEPKPDISIKPFKGVTINATGLSSTTTDENGFYSFTVQKGYSGTITPSYKNFIFFRPNTIVLDNVTADKKVDSIIYNPTLVIPDQINSPLPSPSFPLARFIKQNHFSLPGYPDSPCPDDALPAPWYGWKFWQRGNCPRDGSTGGHIENNVLGADDRFAWDCNISNPSRDLDKGQDVYAPADGIVMTNADFQNWGNDGAAQLLIAHITPSGTWYSGYKHMKLDEKVYEAKSSIDIEKRKIKAGQKLGVVSNISDPRHPVTNHLHFILYYQDPFSSNPKKLRSVDRADGKIVPRIVPATEEYFHFSGSVVSGAEVMIKRDSVWSDYGTSDENGNLQVLFMPAVKQGDSMKIIAAGYEEITLPVDSASITGSNVIIPLMPIFSSSSKIKYASVVSLDQKTFYDNSTVHLKVTGQNISAYDVFKEKDLGDSLVTQTILSDKLATDSMINITLTDIGSNVYRFVFKGNDTVEFYKSFNYAPVTTDFYNATLNVPANIYGSELYIDGAFIKNLTKANESVSLLNGEHFLNVRAAGYKDTTFKVTTAAAYNLSLVPESYQQPDSIIFDFPANGRIQYYSKMTGLDSARKTIVSIKQHTDNFTGMGLIPKSRRFDFTHLNATWSGMRFVTVLDQQERLSTDSIYLLRIFNDTSFTKIPFSVNEVRAKYDSAEQKLGYDLIDFNKGSALKETLVIMKKQAPIVKGFSNLTINADTSLSIPLNQLFADPDSIRNDLNYHLLDTIPTGLHLSLKGDIIIINAEASYTGTTSITIVAEHDSLLAAKTIIVTVISKPLPITLLNFSGTILQNVVHLNWQTSQEINTGKFIIERSSDGRSFSSIGHVKANGNSSATISYSFTDLQPIQGTNFYRLKMVDKDGRLTYSNVIAIRLNDRNKIFQIFPNPANDILYVKASGNNETATLQIIDAAGRKLREQKILLNGNSSFSIDIKNLPKGVYNILFKGKVENDHQKFIKQ